MWTTKAAAEGSSLPAGGWKKEAGNEIIRLSLMKQANPNTKANLAMPTVLYTRERNHRVQVLWNRTTVINNDAVTTHAK